MQPERQVRGASRRTGRGEAPASEPADASCQALFDATPVPAWIEDCASGKRLAVNKAALDHYGYSREEFLGLTGAQLRAESDPPLATGTEEPGSGLREESRRARGGVLMEGQLTRKKIHFQGREAYVFLCQDITGPKQLEQQLDGFTAGLEKHVRERTEQLVAINEELEAFTYSVSHDLRAPLRSIRGFSEALLERYSGQMDERGCDYLRRVCDSSKHMDRLIEELLKLSRVSRAEFRPQNVNLSELAAMIFAELRKAESQRRVTVLVEPGLEAHGDERMLRLLLGNLLRNAWTFTGRQPEARIEFARAPGAEPTFMIRDNGAGFDMHYSTKLFGVFQRLHSSKEFPGTGVGLATARRIVNRHGGRVWAEAAVGQGATFYFTLPAPVKS